ncbi:hypothetical protein AZH53_09825 [Methanomicrobiaceae archaeon CYW5]|uniref:hypothetical protein n=1 Tax=Methanovulcanius yangii TaxID=1789227 RepID=UPI0029CA87A7|nr:hypothetical protein [Methanovulcanius yangii]MBT8508702.1 hypothetical protein [Methanovulcanius yangii]
MGEEIRNYERTNLTETIIETHRDVKWICKTLKEMDARDEDFETRLRTLERWRAERAGAERRTSGMVAGVSGVVGAVAAWVVQWLGMG